MGRGRTITYVGLDVHKETIAFALADGGWARRRTGIWPNRKHANGLGPYAGEAFPAGADVEVLLRSWT
jgi:hypothetical protein